MILRLVKAINRRLRGITNEQLTLEANLKTGLKVGKNVSGLINCTIDYGHCWLIEIGDEVIFAPQVYLLAHDTSTKRSLGYTRIAKIKIENQCFIGARVLIMPGVTIGENSIIGAGSVVVKSIPANVVAAGNPAKVIATIAEYEEKLKNNFENAPQYDYSYTLRGGITDEKKNQMINELENQAGYVI